MKRKKLKCGCRVLVKGNVTDTDVCKKHEKEIKEEYKSQKNKRVS